MKSEKWDWLSVVFGERERELVLKTVRDSGFSALSSESIGDLTVYSFWGARKPLTCWVEGSFA